MKSALDAVARAAGLTSKSTVLDERLGRLRAGAARLEDENVRTAARVTEVLAAVALEVAEEVVDGPAARELVDLRLAREERNARASATKEAIAKLEVELAAAQKGEREEQEEADLRRLCDVYSVTTREAVEALAVALVWLAKARTVEAKWLTRVEAWHRAGGLVPTTAGLSQRNIISAATTRSVALEPALRYCNPVGEEVRLIVASLPPETVK